MSTSHIWVTRFLHSGKLARLPALISSLVVFGLPQVLCLLLIEATNHSFSRLSPRSAYSVSLGLLWIGIGPYLIYLYDSKALPSFFKGLDGVLGNSDIAEKLKIKYLRIFSKKFFWLTIIWCLLLQIGYFSSREFLSVLNIRYFSFMFFLVAAYIVWVGLLTSIGFWGVLVTIGLIREASGRIAVINPFHEDGFGGLGRFGRLAITTTLLFSSGSLYIPLLIDVVTRGVKYNRVHYGLLAIFVGSIAASFLVPIVLVTHRARKLQRGVLKGLSDECSYWATRSSDDIKSQIKAIHDLELHSAYTSLRLCPIKYDTFIKFFTSVLFPVVLLLADKYLLRK